MQKDFVEAYKYSEKGLTYMESYVLSLNNKYLLKIWFSCRYLRKSVIGKMRISQKTINSSKNLSFS